MIRQASSGLASTVNVDSGISSPLASSTSPSTNLTVLSGLSKSPGPSNLTSYPLSVNKSRRRQPVHSCRLKSTNKKSIMKREPKTYRVVLLEEDENKSESYRYSDEMIPGTWFIDFFLDEKEEDINMKLSDAFQSKFPLISSNLFEFVNWSRKTISVPTVCNDLKWDFGHIRSLSGEGKLMCGLL